MKELPRKFQKKTLEAVTALENGDFYKVEKMTKAEVVRSALVHYLLNRDDIADISLIQDRLTEPDIPAHKVHSRLAKKH